MSEVADYKLVRNSTVGIELTEDKAKEVKAQEEFILDEVIETGEDPLVAIRKKKNSSMLVALDLLKQKKVDACVSAGSTECAGSLPSTCAKVSAGDGLANGDWPVSSS
jgi:fatty acid/phospholipid biosynthesis enzyme